MAIKTADTGILTNPVIAIKGGGDLATGIALRLYMSGFTRLFIMEATAPTVIRRKVAFASAVYDHSVEVEGVTAVLAESPEEIPDIWDKGEIPVLADPVWQSLTKHPPHVLVDAVIAKKNLGTRMQDADLTIGLGPGFTAGEDVDLVIETQRGHNLGRLIYNGSAAANTSQPEAVMGITRDRLLRAPCSGEFKSGAAIGDRVVPGQILGHVGKRPVTSKIKGVVRGLIHDGLQVDNGRKIGDVDPRNRPRYCFTVSDKARALGGSVLEAVLGRINRPTARIAGIILAAGTGTRMGKLKQLLPFRGKPILACPLDQGSAAGLSPVILVLGHEAETVKKSIGKTKADILVNPDYAGGMASSVVAGVRRLDAHPQVKGALFLLGDQPLVSRAVIRDIIKTAEKHPDRIIIPVFQGKRGNPVYFGRCFFDDLKTLSGDTGGRSLFRQFPEAVLEVPVETDAILTDIDTPEDYNALCQKEAR